MWGRHQPGCKHNPLLLVAGACCVFAPCPALPLAALQANDLFAIMNAVPAIALILYGFLTPTMSGSLCFGAGLGITLFGIAYMFVHDGLVHR